MHSSPCTQHNLSLGLATIAGYVVRKTYFDDTPHQDVATFDQPTDYGQAVDVARTVRLSGHNGYAVVDSTHICGCRVAG